MNPENDYRVIDPQRVIDRDEARADKAYRRKEARSRRIAKRISRRVIKKLDKSGHLSIPVKGPAGVRRTSYSEDIYDKVREQLRESENEIDFNRTIGTSSTFGLPPRTKWVDTINITKINGRDMTNEASPDSG